MSKSAAAQQLSTDTRTVTSSSGTTFKRPDAGGDSEISYVRLGKLQAGDTVVEGIYLGSSQNTTYPEKLDFKFKSADDKTVIVNEGGNMKFRMSEIEAGTLVLIKYNGMQLITKGPRKGKEAHAVDVLIAE